MNNKILLELSVLTFIILIRWFVVIYDKQQSIIF